jgi:hypothetical protein
VSIMSESLGRKIDFGDGKPWEVIDVYTRAQAIEDGVLIDITAWAKEYGFKFPVAVTASVWSLIDDPEGMKCAGQSAKGRGLDVVAMLKMYARRGGTTIFFPVIFAIHLYKKNGDLHEARKTFKLKAVCGPGDNLEPVITVMLPEED